MDPDHHILDHLHILTYNQSIHWPTYLSNVHPAWPVHQLMTDLVTSYWLNITKWMCSEKDETKFTKDSIHAILSTLPLHPPIFYNGSDDVLGQCVGSRLFSLMTEDLHLKNVTELVPHADAQGSSLHPGGLSLLMIQTILYCIS